jgi:hypothetical protein
MFVIAAAPVMPVVVLDTTPETSAAVSVTAPVLVATLVTAAETVPLETLKPLPTITAPAAETVASGNRATGRVPELMLVATVVSVVALVASPLMSLALSTTAPVRVATLVTAGAV